MNPQEIFCPNLDCPARGQIGAGNISVHSQKEERYECQVCETSFAASTGTIFYRLKTEVQVVLIVLTLLAHGCPLQAIVAAYGFDERTVSSWWQRAGQHCQKVHQHTVGQHHLDLQHVQADEIKVKTQGGPVWMAVARCIPPEQRGEFVCHMEDILEVYHRPLDSRRPLVCLDELPYQLISETRSPLPLGPGQRQCYDYEYKREGVVNIFMVFAPLLGQRWTRITQRRTYKDWAYLVRDIVDSLFPTAVQVILVMD